MDFLIFGIGALFLIGIIIMIRRVMKKDSKRHQWFDDFARERKLKYSFQKIGIGGGFNKVEGNLDGCDFLLQEMSAGNGPRTRYYKTVAIIQCKNLDFNFIIGEKHVSAIPKELKELSPFDLGLKNSKLEAKTDDPQKMSNLMTLTILLEIKSAESDFESAIVGHNGNLIYTAMRLMPNENKFQSYSKIIDSMLTLKKEIG